MRHSAMQSYRAIMCTVGLSDKEMTSPTHDDCLLPVYVYHWQWSLLFPNFPRSIYLRNLQWIRQIAGHVNLLIYEDNVQGISCYSGQYCCVITACWVSCFVVCGCDSWCIL